jgi:hypothetical protein
VNRKARARIAAAKIAERQSDLAAVAAKQDYYSQTVDPIDHTGDDCRGFRRLTVAERTELSARRRPRFASAQSIRVRGGSRRKATGTVGKIDLETVFGREACMHILGR